MPTCEGCGSRFYQHPSTGAERNDFHNSWILGRSFYQHPSTGAERNVWSVKWKYCLWRFYQHPSTGAERNLGWLGYIAVQLFLSAPEHGR